MKHGLDQWFLFIVSLALFGFGLYAAVMALVTPSVIDHCYTEPSPGFWGQKPVRLKGNVEWGPDQGLGEFDYLEEAAAAGDRLHCAWLKPPAAAAAAAPGAADAGGDKW